MTREELNRAIKNGESVWGILETNELIEIVPSKIKVYDKKSFFYGEDYFMFMEDVYKTKAEAEHYLHHANVTRTETLPFLTWEEFLEKEHIEFFNGGKGFGLYISYAHNENIRIITFGRYNPDGNVLFDLPKTEENFYKAYDECVRLFKEGV